MTIGVSRQLVEICRRGNSPLIELGWGSDDLSVDESSDGDSDGDE
jgi:hypothetical protein